MFATYVSLPQTRWRAHPPSTKPLTISAVSKFGRSQSRSPNCCHGAYSFVLHAGAYAWRVSGPNAAETDPRRNRDAGADAAPAVFRLGVVERLPRGKGVFVRHRSLGWSPEQAS